jgi:hypothetical protein
MEHISSYKAATLKGVALAVSDDETRQALRHCILSEESPMVCGTDGHRIHIARPFLDRVKLVSSEPHPDGIETVSLVGLQPMVDALAKEKTPRYIEVTRHAYKCGRAETRNPWADDFRPPPVLQVIPDWFPYRGTKTLAQWAETTRQRRAGLPVGLAKIKAPKKGAPTVYLDDGQLLLSCPRPCLDLSGQGKGKVVGVNLRYLVEAVQFLLMADSAVSEVCAWFGADPLDPIVLANSFEEFAIVMPMRV